MQYKLDPKEIGSNFQVLNDREQNIICRRYGLSGAEKQTLESIGKLYGVSRERIRQIEVDILGKLKRNGDTNLINQCIKNVFTTIDAYGGVICMSDFLGKDGKANFVEMAIASSSLIYKYKGLYVMKSIKKESINSVLEFSKTIIEKHRKAIKQVDFLNLLSAKLISKKIKFSPLALIEIIKTSDSVLQYKDGYYGDANCGELFPKLLKDMIYVVLSESKDPMHFADIHKGIEYKFKTYKSFSVDSIHNELIRNSEFALIGRGIYALKEWGYRNETVKEIILRILKESENPLKISEIIAIIAKAKRVKDGTIRLGVQRLKREGLIKRLARATYSLK